MDYESFQSLLPEVTGLDTSESFLIASSKATGVPVVNAWTQQPQEHPAEKGPDMDVDTTGEGTSVYRFMTSVYTASEITTYRQICETSYEFPNNIREPTKQKNYHPRTTRRNDSVCSPA
ncbi:Hypothetical protein PHPALM_1281 [Phytophthora palmivora]|uniref:Uncharacterized protein n=1 Tax=Phytophthora palmivora TaxID=4796 RepID=A0A2P4YSQ5_9STRA|nr:Hypothetical protein PHPALM_1281 [Phytophthora palmivora]